MLKFLITIRRNTMIDYHNFRTGLACFRVWDEITAVQDRGEGKKQQWEEKLLVVVAAAQADARFGVTAVSPLRSVGRAFVFLSLSEI